MTRFFQDDSLNSLRKTSVIILPQPPVVEGDNNVYTLTLTDGSVVQLRVQNDVLPPQQQQQQMTQLTQLLQQHQQQQLQLQQLKEEQAELTTLESCCWLQSEGSESRCADCESCSGVRQTRDRFYKTPFRPKTFPDTFLILKVCAIFHPTNTDLYVNLAYIVRFYP
jgi:hypothetical protein